MSLGHRSRVTHVPPGVSLSFDGKPVTVGDEVGPGWLAVHAERDPLAVADEVGELLRAVRG